MALTDTDRTHITIYNIAILGGFRFGFFFRKIILKPCHTILLYLHLAEGLSQPREETVGTNAHSGLDVAVNDDRPLADLRLRGKDGVNHPRTAAGGGLGEKGR